jgi:transglutaminase-like putative cysteine protease
MIYDISLHIEYKYDTQASGGRHVIRVLPVTIPGRQRLIAGSVTMEPKPDERVDNIDYFNNPATSVVLRHSHEGLDIHMHARVAVEQVPMSADFSPALAQLPDDLTANWSLDANSPHHFIGESPRLQEDSAIAAWARKSATENPTVRSIAIDLCKRIYTDFEYDPKATTVDTDPRQAFRIKKGVCQDFAHIMIIALRGLGIPAGYVSGFLRTKPPAGKERLAGADAMHAWVRVWCGQASGWLELDPTNNMQAGTDHIVVGYGRDYSDVAPVIGVLKSYGNQNTKQAVDVIPVEATN